MASIPQAPPSAPTRSLSRMGWLDALRGYAALVVALYHLSPSVIGTGRHRAIHEYIDFGRYGVLVFFLVSGYVIPMSLERHGSLRKFWVGRLFRIYPAYLATIAALAVITYAGMHGLNPSLRKETVTGVLGHVTMLTDHLGLRGLAWPFWTLSYEMIFYLVVAGMFVLKLHRLSVWWAGGLALIAAVGATRLPDDLLGGDFTTRRITAAVLLLVFTASLAAYVSGRPALVRAAAVAGLCFLALPLLNGHATSFSNAISSSQAAQLVAVLFAGTVIYRLHHRQVAPWAGGVALAAVLFVSMGITWLNTAKSQHLISGSITTLAVAVTFAAAFALRHRDVPRPLTWLGEVSYSLYLLHWVVLHVVLHYLTAAGWRGSAAGRAGIAVVFLVGTLVVAWACYRFVEIPGQTLGRDVMKRLDRSLGKDTGEPGRNAGTPPAAPPADPNGPTQVLPLVTPRVPAPAVVPAPGQM
ncbi:acyltransferase family protein [Actinoplanes utahensis]|uniref:acyltransferase family protein n=1 Tax=Actinoplanes utahensis TaxID=1869 RepID=UPI000A073F42|nr:acyltransferase [Actinoplanes utahensis]